MKSGSRSGRTCFCVSWSQFKDFYGADSAGFRSSLPLLCRVSGATANIRFHHYSDYCSLQRYDRYGTGGAGGPGDRRVEKSFLLPHAPGSAERQKAECGESWELVPGDVVILKAGDLVPADIRLVKSVELRELKNRLLQGNPCRQKKDAGTICPVDATLAERKNMVFAGTGVASGAGVGIVTATGMETGMGQIATMLENEKAPQTPLQQKLNRLEGFGRRGAGDLRSDLWPWLNSKIEPLDMFMIAISPGCGGSSGGLTAVVTIVLAMGIKRMAQKREPIVRHMPAVETLGSTQVICSDKTGTLTQNKMTVVAFSGAYGEEKLEGDNRSVFFGACFALQQF